MPRRPVRPSNSASFRPGLILPCSLFSKNIGEPCEFGTCRIRFGSISYACAAEKVQPAKSSSG
jgi:hypothetical protein